MFMLHSPPRPPHHVTGLLPLKAFGIGAAFLTPGEPAHIGRVVDVDVAKEQSCISIPGVSGSEDPIWVSWSRAVRPAPMAGE